ncbi:fasciclin domain-containing protein [Winogradskyella maritima]|uniref:Fasciclin domain-containing protein n=1 Tax=Winogradskyella maritima TaxID=1517766 RepID=A0ABV8AJA8_9FLAO|nr:fasciclin domain-containing protein [Winogradskyella maritima]
MKVLRTIGTLAVAGLLFASCADNKKSETEEDMNTNTEMAVADDVEVDLEVQELEQPTVVGVAMTNDNFSTLVTAVKSADLVGTLNSEGPFTVFAPTNDAFNKLPEGTVSTLLKDENKAQLTGILTYHVVSGKFKASDVINAINDANGKFIVNTVQGEALTLSLDGDNVKITDANGNMSTIVMTDVDASNGIIHAIDTVIMPKS